MNLLIVGGSAHSTPQLFAALPRSTNSLEVTLAGRSLERLHAVGAAIRAVTVAPLALEFSTLGRDELERAARRADAVLIQARVGGYAAREYDESFPHEEGIGGDEGLGPGGLAAAWRTWPFLSEVLEAIEAAGSAPAIMLLTSPLGLLVRCARMAFPQADLVGICELPWVTLRDVAARTGTALEDVTFEYAGVNHIGWFTLVTDGSRDLIAAYARTLDARAFPSAALIAESEALPLKYVRLHYDRAAVVAEQRAAPSRAATLDGVRTMAYESFRTGRRESILTALERRPAPWYEYAVAHRIKPVDATEPAPFVFLTTRNDGYLPWLANDDVVEVPHRVTARGLERSAPVTCIPAGVRAILDAFVRYEAAAARAVAERDRAALEAALELHPWVDGSAAAARLAARVVSSPGVQTIRE